MYLINTSKSKFLSDVSLSKPLVKLLLRRLSAPHWLRPLLSFFSARLDLQLHDNQLPDAGMNSYHRKQGKLKTCALMFWLVVRVDTDLWSFPLWRTIVLRPTTAPWLLRKMSSSIPAHTPSWGKHTSHWSSDLCSHSGRGWRRSEKGWDRFSGQGCFGRLPHECLCDCEDNPIWNRLFPHLTSSQVAASRQLL